MPVTMDQSTSGRRNKNARSWHNARENSVRYQGITNPVNESIQSSDCRLAADFPADVVLLPVASNSAPETGFSGRFSGP